MKTAERIWVVTQQGADDLSYMALDNKTLDDRQHTGRRWAKTILNWTTREEVLGIEKFHQNTPTSGFDVFKSVARYRGNKLARVRDPRGFVIEISMANLIYLIGNTTLINGIVQDLCVWGKDNDGNILIPVDSLEYKELMNPLEPDKPVKLVNIKHVKKGDLCLLKDGDELVYCGRHAITGKVCQGDKFVNASFPEYFVYKSDDKKKFRCFKTNQVISIESSGNNFDIPLNNSEYNFFVRDVGLRFKRWEEIFHEQCDHPFHEGYIEKGWNSSYSYCSHHYDCYCKICPKSEPILFVATEIKERL